MTEVLSFVCQLNEHRIKNPRPLRHADEDQTLGVQLVLEQDAGGIVGLGPLPQLGSLRADFRDR